MRLSVFYEPCKDNTYKHQLTSQQLFEKKVQDTGGGFIMKPILDSLPAFSMEY